MPMYEKGAMDCLGHLGYWGRGYWWQNEREAYFQGWLRADCAPPPPTPD
jgi:hypothetical protein